MRKQVLHVIYSLFRGGAEKHIETIATAPSTKYRHLVCSLTSGDELVDSMRSAGIPVFLLGKKFRGDPGVMLPLVRLIRDQRVDIIHLHNTSGTFWGTLAAILARTSIPIVRTEHSPYIPARSPLLYRSLHSYLTGRSEKIICVSDHVKKSLIANLPRWKDKYVTIHNGINIDKFKTSLSRKECRSRFKLPADAGIVGTIGRLIALKNHARLIQSLPAVRKEVKDVHLVILGEGELKSKLRQLSVDFGVSDSVSFLPSTDDIDEFLRSLDVYILPSLSEGLPLTLLEALAAGIPAVASSVGGIPEIIKDGYDGYLISPVKEDEIAGRITDLLRHGNTAADFARRGEETVRDRFSAEQMISRTEELYDKLPPAGSGD